uniref:uncharacterized protein LOC122609099 n=1 Tax=Erigeron canadensis TaxID=72917 RepID=UPI001CB99FB5|nr:uncharacterized protein LOC122609099 [Erigeron canadensis]
MYADLKPIYWWPNIKGEVAHCVERCLTYARVKADHKKPYGMLQQLEIPELVGGYVKGMCIRVWWSMDDHLKLIEFAYNNSYHVSIGMSPFEMLYGNRCRTPSCWLEPDEKQFMGPGIIEITAEKVNIAKEALRLARERHKTYADKKRRSIEF